MTEPITSFARLLDPVAPETFFAEVHHRKPLHVPGGADKFASVMSWDILNEMLAMDVWDANTLALVLDRQRVPPASYSRTVQNRNQRQILQPDAGKVVALIGRGASLVLNNIETLHPGCLAVAETIGRRLGAKVSANLYCSQQQHQAFDSHCDRHDVFALHVVGKKHCTSTRAGSTTRSSTPPSTTCSRPSATVSKAQSPSTSPGGRAICSSCRAVSSTTRSPAPRPPST